ncbi:YdeI/OmpD-associated family protein [Nakamurella aerolata]|uniref:YdeI/OmpD-associated family protein n=1 Tax=Nakamurella aerolata TaxID=1656892 RepID=UPI001BB2C3F5|nr:YdeI/OmpD-associated family protein [Nakamurella aerolata]
MIRFTTTLELHGKTATGFQVPPEVVAELGSGKKPKVTVHIGRHRYRSTVAVYGGVFMLPLSAENRTAAGVSAGDTITVGLALDTAERTVNVPDDLADALNTAGLQAAFDALSFSKQRGHVELVTGAKAAETRRRRVDRVLAALR